MESLYRIISGVAVMLLPVYAQRVHSRFME
jgi:hypothetical protein